MSRRTLIGLAYSPWTERARWALDYHALSHRFVPYTPMLGEPLLRARTRRFVGRISVPVLFTDEAPLLESLPIVRYADRTGPGRPLIPQEHEDVISAWADRAEAGLSAGRVLLLQNLMRNPAALAAAAPAFLPAAARSLAGASGVQYLRLKYGARTNETQGHAAIVERMLQTASQELDRAGGVFLLREFSFADIVMATALCMVKPIEGPHATLSAVERDAWTNHPLAERYEHLLHWRDAIYARFRGEHAGPA